MMFEYITGSSLKPKGIDANLSAMIGFLFLLIPVILTWCDPGSALKVTFGNALFTSSSRNIDVPTPQSGTKATSVWSSACMYAMAGVKSCGWR
jgi:hypothetical protein